MAAQSPPNLGSLVPTGSLPGLVGTTAGFDIHTDRVYGRAVDNQGFASLLVGTTYRLYEVEPATGQVASRGSFPWYAPVFDVALPTYDY
ncbi:hypothetical protein FAIPA1_10312 [Frankia sp. AiPs1]